MPEQPTFLSISIVVYRSDATALIETLSSLSIAVVRLEQPRFSKRSCALILVDNDSMGEARKLIQSPRLSTILQSFASVRVLDDHGNVGYGRGHNLAIEGSKSRFHLILNPDVVLDPASLVFAINFLEAHPTVVLLSPKVHDQQGRLQYLCKRYPSVFDLLLRGFVPLPWRTPFARRLARYEMQDVIGEDRTVDNPPLVSGCFMLFRMDVLRQLEGFDPRYFLYFEDYDLSLRAGRIGTLVYVPEVAIVHRGGDAARKGFRHIQLFLTSAMRFFSTHGWKLW